MMVDTGHHTFAQVHRVYNAKGVSPKVATIDSSK